MSECKTTILVTCTHKHPRTHAQRSRTPRLRHSTRTKQHGPVRVHTHTRTLTHIHACRCRCRRVYSVQYFIYFPVKFCAHLARIWRVVYKQNIHMDTYIHTTRTLYTTSRTCILRIYVTKGRRHRRSSERTLLRPIPPLWLAVRIKYTHDRLCARMCALSSHWTPPACRTETDASSASSCSLRHASVLLMLLLMLRVKHLSRGCGCGASMSLACARAPVHRCILFCVCVPLALAGLL